MAKRTEQKLQDTSWLAQAIKEKMDVESAKSGLMLSDKWHCLQTLHAIVNEADNPENENIFYYKDGCKRQIIIRDIPSLAMEHGTDFDREGMRSRLLGLAAKYTDDDGMYLVRVCVTHDLNSAVITDISELLFVMAA